MARFPLWLKAVLLTIPALLLIASLVIVAVGWYVKNQMLESGGKLRPELAAYDVRHYDLSVAVDPDGECIRGSNVATVVALESLAVFEIHLDDRLDVESVRVDGVSAGFGHDEGLITVELAERWSAGSRHRVAIVYGGRPKVALRAPWIDGFVWSRTPSGRPWIGVTSEGDGGDNWWPCKDHPSDEPDEGMDLSLTAPEDLVGLSNGRLMGETVNGDGTVTSRWRVGYPINNYCVTVNIGPYEPVEIGYPGVSGDLDETLVFWATPEVLGKVRGWWEQTPRVLAVLGRRFGEVPFLSDKLWVVHAPFLGMEHQTLVAYGGDFGDNDFGFDELLLHELAHEWWGNKITVSDFADLWIHEGFATYSEALYVLDTLGEERYLDYLHRLLTRSAGRSPLILGKDLASTEVYSPDIYVKGAWVLHMLRLLLGEAVFDEVLWIFADGDRPGACRLVTTREFVDLVESVGGAPLDWFWERYLHTGELPSWAVARSSSANGDVVVIEWNDPSFEMPLPVTVGGTRELVAMPGGRAKLSIEPGVEIVVDPDREILTAEPNRWSQRARR